MAESPSSIGPYVIDDVLGEGGMGVVYRARQTRPIERWVALKTLRASPGEETREVLTRFEAERQVLARMTHPGIAQVYDAGTTDDGRPYFAMEYIEGLPLDAYCDGERMGVRDRVALFVQVCRAVQHAHQRGIIHRDLKPGNILVTTVDGAPVPKVIDFGIARAVEASADRAARLTRDGRQLGTPAYMSPEQAEGSDDIDTRTDVYALGVILYELLVGLLPHPAEAYLGLQGLATILTKEVPALPTRFDSVSDTQATLAAARSTTPAALRRELSGEIRWIVAAACEKRREDRYGSVQELAEDAEAFLAHRPVGVGPPSTAYRVRKFVRRNRVAVTAGAAVVVALVGGTAAALVGLVQAREAAAEARAAEAERALEARTATRVADFMVDLFDAANPFTARGEVPDAEDMLELGARRVEEELAGEPRVQARLLAVLARAYGALDENQQAGALYDAAVTILESDSVDLGVELADALWRRQDFDGMRRPGLRDPVAEMERAFALADRSLAFGDSLWIGHWVRLLEAYREAGDGESLEAQIEPVVARAEEELAPGDPGLGRLLRWAAYHDPAWWSDDPGDHARPEARYARAIEVARRLPAGDSLALEIAGSRTIQYLNSGRYAEAAAFYDENLGRLELLYGSGEALAAEIAVAGYAYGEAGRPAEAIEAYREALLIARESMGPFNPEAESYFFNLDVALAEEGRHDERVELLEDAVRSFDTGFPPGHDWRLLYRSSLAEAYRDAGRGAEARAVLLERVEGALAFLGREDTSERRRTFRSTVVDYVRDVLAEDPGADFDELYERVADDPRATADLQHALGFAFGGTPRAPEAPGLYRRALAARERLLGPDHPDVALLVQNLAVHDAQEGRLEDALAGYRRAARIIEAASGPDSPELLAPLRAQAGLLGRRGAALEEIRIRRRILDITRRRFGPGHAETGIRAQELAFALLAAGRLDEAGPAFEQARDVYEGIGWRADQSIVDFGVAQIRWARGEREEALASLDPAVERFLAAAADEERADFYGQVAALQCLRAEWLESQGRPEEARSARAEAATLFDRHPDSSAPDRHWNWGPVAERRSACGADR